MTLQTSIIMYIVLTLTGRFLSQRQRRNRQSQSLQWQSIIEDPTAVISVISVAIAIGLALTEAALRQNALFQIKTASVGAVILMIGWIIAYSANREIGANWSPIIEKTKKQNLVTSGVYGFIRHPLYLSGLCILIGTNLYFSSKWAWVGTLVVLITILLRVPIEEKKLKERFGEEYIAYIHRTKAIVPWIF